MDKYGINTASRTPPYLIRIGLRIISAFQITINEDNSITVADNGRGIPIGINQKAGIPAVEVVFTVLYAGGKFLNNSSLPIFPHSFYKIPFKRLSYGCRLKAECFGFVHTKIHILLLYLLRNSRHLQNLINKIEDCFCRLLRMILNVLNHHFPDLL